MQKKSFHPMAIADMEALYIMGFDVLAEDINKHRNTQNGS